MRGFLSLIIIFLFSCLSLMVFGEESAYRNMKDVKVIHEQAKSLTRTRNYVHTWEGFPMLKGRAVSTGERVEIKPIFGQVEVLFFLASWCVPCQDVMEDFKRIEKIFDNKNVRISYVFTHDTIADVKGFLQAYKVADGIIAESDSLVAFHNPPLPTVYVSDERGWIVTRYEKLTVDLMPDLEKKLKLLTIF